jgi:hypothetical protein
MTEAGWLECTDPELMLEFLRGKASDRKLRLFATARCREVWPLFTEQRSRDAVEMAEQWAENRNESALAAAHAAAMVGFQEALDKWIHRLPVHATEQDASNAALLIANHRGPTLWHRASIANQIREVFGNPCHPSPPINPIILGWNDGIVVKLAQGIYDERAFDRLPILADALEEAGCQDADILGHCRHAAVHVRGCWVVDLLTGRS